MLLAPPRFEPTVSAKVREELRGILASRRGCPGVEPGEFVGIVHQTMRPILTGGNGKEVVQRLAE